jgi:uncharacterized protein (DUF2141 family)
MKAFLTLGTVLALALFCFGAKASELRVAVQGVASSLGSLMIGLYDSEEHFRSAIANAATAGLLNDRSRLVGIAMRAVAGTQGVVFTNLEPGTYAVIVFHDENDNGKLDESPWGAHRGLRVQQQRRRIPRGACLQGRCRDAWQF